MKVSLSDEELVRIIKTSFYSVISDYFAGWIFNEYDMVKSFYAAISPILSKYQLPLLSEVPLTHMGLKGNLKKVDLAIIRLREDYNAYTDLRSKAIEEIIAVLEFKYITIKDTDEILDDITKLKSLRSRNTDMFQFLIILHEAKISEDLAKKFYNPEADKDPKKWARYYEFHFVPKLSPMDYFVTIDN